MLDFFEDVLPLIGAIIAIAFILYLSYLFSKFMAKRVGNISNSGNIKICERVALGQDKGLVVTHICGKYYLLGISNNNISMLKELEEYTPPEVPQTNINFKDVLSKVNLKKGTGWKVSGKDE